MSKIKSRIIIIFLYSSITLFSQEFQKEFEGVIEYAVQVKDIETNEEDYSAYTGTKNILYYKKGKLRTDYYIDDVLIRTTYSFTYSDSSYTLFQGDTVLYKYINNSDFEYKERGPSTNILSYQCKSGVFEHLHSISGKEIVYYSKDISIKVDSKITNLPYSQIKSLDLKHIVLINNIERIVKSATNIKEKTLLDSIFKIDNVNIIYEKPPVTREYQDLANYFLKCGNYKNAIIFYNKAQDYIDDLYKNTDNNKNRHYISYSTIENDLTYNKAITYLKMKENIAACKELEFIKNQKDEEAIKLFEKYCNCDALIPYLNKELNKLIEESNYKKAIGICNKIIECNTNDTSIIFIRGVSNYNMRKFHLAFDDFILAKENGSKRAEDFITKDFNQNQKLIVYNKKGDISFENEEYQKAINFYTLVLDELNNSPSVLRKRGLSEIIMDNKTEGCLDLKKAIEYSDTKSIKLYKKHCN